MIPEGGEREEDDGEQRRRRGKLNSSRTVRVGTTSIVNWQPQTTLNLEQVFCQQIFCSIGTNRKWGLSKIDICVLRFDPRGPIPLQSLCLYLHDGNPQQEHCDTTQQNPENSLFTSKTYCSQQNPGKQNFLNMTSPTGAQSPWSVVVLGDSWAAYMHPTWPEVVARRIPHARCFNCANAGSVSADLPLQAQRAVLRNDIPRGPNSLLHANTLVVIHTGGIFDGEAG